MEVWFRVYIVGPWLRKRRVAKAKAIREEIAHYEWAYGNRVPDTFSDFCKQKIVRLKEELKQVLLKG